MKKTINFYDFRNAFEHRPNNFTPLGLQALYDYLIEIEESEDHEFELDPIAFCCDFTEWESLEDFRNNHKDIEGLTTDNYLNVIGKYTVIFPVLDENEKETGRFITLVF
jgi:hypothetical protein